MSPILGYVIKHHVVFTKDGALLGATEQHAARRNQCRTWWNAEWRDRLLAALAWSADDRGRIELAVSNGDSIVVSAKPVEFSSPVSYVEPADVVFPESRHDEDECEGE